MSIIGAWENVYSKEQQDSKSKSSKVLEDWEWGHFGDYRKSDYRYSSYRGAGGIRVTTTWFCLSCEVCVCPKCPFSHFKERNIWYNDNLGAWSII